MASYSQNSPSADVSLGEGASIPRSASHTYLPLVSGTTPEEPLNNPLKRTLSENVLATLPGEYGHSFSDSQSRVTPVHQGLPLDDRVNQQKAARSSAPKITMSKFRHSSEKIMGDTSYESRTTSKLAKCNTPESKTRGVPESFASFARKSWRMTPSSRSPSPSSRKYLEEVDRAPISPSGTSKAPASQQNGDSELKDSGYAMGSKVVSKKGSPLQNRLTRRPSKPSLFKTPSLERMPSVRSSFSSERLRSLPVEASRKKDELWSIFRGLDSDFNKFQSRSSALKANVVRSSLLPFLRDYAQHGSNKSLRPEDLDRRTNILNKWWTGLLESLSGKSNLTISGTDRPVLLEGITGIMTRPEWRLSPSSFAPLTDQSFRNNPKSRSTSSLESSASEFLTESVHHNVRNTFIQNLLAQVRFVVDKMSLKQAPSSLVTFCGKALAYAFYFCPGIAEVLVRLWATPSGAIRRVLNEFRIDRAADMKKISESIVLGFPNALEDLGFASYPSMIKHLRKRPALPVGTNIPCDGPWLGRWCGRDSDLFFVFCKYYHILLAEFLPPEVSIREKASAPAFVVVHAQVLTLLDATICRRQGTESSVIAPPTTFDDVLAGVDAPVATLPLSSVNVARSVPENRLIMLLRDMLSERQLDIGVARHNFAETFSNLLKAAARNISIFDHSSCFTLCDFMDEAIPILVRFLHNSTQPRDYIDWEFWLEVCKQMVESQNSMTALRLFGFLFSIWGIVSSDEQRKDALCLGWLLSEVIFDKYFNHWCPMVRAYYMRLLCWRVARYDGSASEVDIKILETLSKRLRKTWYGFLYLRDKCSADNLLPPSTAPCNPAPGRRLLIMRNDIQVDPDSVFLSFDGVFPSLSNQPTAYREHSSLAQLSQTDPPHPKLDHDSALEPLGSPPKKRWGLFRNILPFSSPLSDGYKSDDGVDTSRQISSATIPGSAIGNDEDISRRPAQIKAKLMSKETSTQLGPKQDIHQHRYRSFKFSLEWTEKPSPSGKDRRLSPPRLPMPAQVFLQSRASKSSHIPDRNLEPRSSDCSKYSGRALAEWAQVITECQNFFERRRAEGVPTDECVETPSLGVETFRKLG
ncbi:hypothetical protein FGG08_002928 [Glutinoglossum americanum]|uniref:DUF1765-domain-containing protein n=1 Tax=Glutinoglossum americanum TaxID=1670608 RepID=A0A9P8I5D6_9PEZI|nr:hypothetical protein FGG08_002928 [Glutinoglossum americanum]